MDLVQTEMKTSGEIYSFNFSSEELKEIQNVQERVIYKKSIYISVALLLFLIYLAYAGSLNVTLGIGIGIVFVCVIINIGGLLAYRKIWKRNNEKVMESTYQYEMFDNRFEIKIFRAGEQVSSSIVEYCDIENVQKLTNHYLLQINNQIYIMRKDGLKPTSVFLSYLHMHPKKLIERTTTDKWKMTSIILFVLSLCSILLALMLVGYASNQNGLFTENMWLFFVATPIPISSVVFGFIATKKGYKCKKNIVVGIIMTLLLCIYGSFIFIF